jgi:hypothetical protein
MVLSKTQEKELIKLYWTIFYYGQYLEDFTYQPYDEVQKWAKKLRSIIGNDELINKLNPVNHEIDSQY